MTLVENVNVGRADVKQTTPSHVRGVHEGNQPRRTGRMARLTRRGRIAATAARSTGINPDRRNPIDPRMPNLSPA